jgi:hypothetical protein
MSLPLPGASANDLLNLPDNWMKSIVLERRFSGYSFFAAEKRLTGSKGFESKTGKDTSKRSACLSSHKTPHANVN